MSAPEQNPDQEARPAAEAIASALYHWQHDCNRMGHGVIQCGGCGVELNGFVNRDGDGLAEDVHLTLRQKGWLVVPVSEVADAKEADDRRRAEVESYRTVIDTALKTMAVANDMQLGPGGVARKAYAGLWHAYFAIPVGIETPPPSDDSDLTKEADRG